MLKFIFCVSLCLCTIGLPSFAELTPQDLDKIRLIIYEENQSVKTEVTAVKTEIAAIKTEIAAVKTEIAAIKTEIAGVKDEIVSIKTEVSWIRGKLDKYLAWPMVLIVVAIGIPQIVVAWRSRKDRAQEKQIEALRQEIEALKEQVFVSR